jgi:hypothetical protein
MRQSRHAPRWFTLRHASALVVTVLAGCGGSNTRAAPPKICDAECQDEIVVRGVREMMKLAFNLTLQGKPVGDHDLTVPCPLGGRVRVVGNATSNAKQGSTEVNLAYTFEACKYLSKNANPEETYDLAVSGTVKQNGIIAIQPTATTALGFECASLDATGTVYDPPISMDTKMCSLRLQQSANRLAGSLCERKVAVDL